MKFGDMNISARTIEALNDIKYIEATEVQERTIPLVLQGKEVVVRSKTGSGKTAVFGIGLIELILKNRDKQGLVIAPTRELAVQLTNELRAIGKKHRMKVYAIYGGQSIERQITLLRTGFNIVVATPGRLLDHVRRGTIKLENVKLVVLDEADRMLDMGFKEDIDAILKETNDEKQMLLFSATIDYRIKEVASDYMNDPEIIEVGSEEVQEIEDQTITLKRREKISRLKEILRRNSGVRVIVFVATKRSVEYVCNKLNENRIKARYLHGGKTQNQRERTVDDFKDGKFKVLIATDVAARGLHIENVELIINFDKAESDDMHRHRIGRTGRMGKKGKAITLLEIDPYVPKSERRDIRESFGGPQRRRSHSVYIGS